MPPRSTGKDYPEGTTVLLDRALLTVSAAVSPGRARLDPGERFRTVAAFGLIAAQVLLLALVIRAFRIQETFGLGRVAPLIVGGFVVHAWTPMRLRAPLFVLLSVAGIDLVLGHRYGLALVGIGLVIFAICHLPIHFWARVGLLIAVAGGLASARSGLVHTPGYSASAIIPLLASMFMFRTAIYLYVNRHESESVSIWQRLGYFFMLPNACFLLFPVVDYQTFRRTHYDANPFAIYQKGALWMMRGVTHILAYRIVLLFLLPAPPSVDGLGEVVKYIVTTYALYLNVSGQFHLVVGILCLFGFNLPETHRLYFLASSFTDYWRRINIYWKDFMTKLVYYPSFMRFRGRGMIGGMVISTAAVFGATWLLHSYQWFWLNGNFPVRANDILFWAILCAFVIVNSLREARVRGRRVPDKTWDAGEALRYSARVVGMFALISFLWSFWNAPSVAEWLTLMGRARSSGAEAWAKLALLLAGAVVIGFAVQYARAKARRSKPAPGWMVGVRTATVGVLLLLFTNPAFLKRASEPGSRANRLAKVAAATRFEGLGDALAALENSSADPNGLGYYDGLLAAPTYSASLTRIAQGKPADWDPPFGQTEVARPRDDLVPFELVPSVRGRWAGVEFATNEWALHDRYGYPLQKAPGTYRIAAIGSSYVMGFGVDQTRRFEALVEMRLNRARPAPAYDQYEILNFGLPALSIVSNTVMIDERVLQFHPDVAVTFVTAIEPYLFGLTLEEYLTKHGSLGVPELDAILTKAGVVPGMSSAEITARIRPNMGPVFQWAFTRMAESCRRAGVIPAVAFLPITFLPSSELEPMATRMLEQARAAGIVTIDLNGAFDGWTEDQLRLVAWDAVHPNSTGHALIAKRLYEQILAQADELGLTHGTSATDSTIGGAR